MSNNNYACPGCGSGVPFGLQRCCGCGTWIFWEGHGKEDRVPVKREHPVVFPQKGEIVFDGIARKQADLTSEAVVSYQDHDRVIAIAIFGDFYLLKTGGWIHYGRVALFGKLTSIKLFEQSDTGTNIPVLDSPRWGANHEECGGVIRYAHADDRVTVYKAIPGWICISDEGNGEWVSNVWVHPDDMRRFF